MKLEDFGYELLVKSNDYEVWKFHHDGIERIVRYDYHYDGCTISSIEYSYDETIHIDLRQREIIYWKVYQAQ